MKSYKKKVKMRMVMLSIVATICAGICVFDQFFANESLRNNSIYSFQLGAMCAIAILCAIDVVKYKKILNDQNKLKCEYNKENDERNKVIRSKAGIPIILYTSVSMIIVGVIAGFFNIVIFEILIIVALCQLSLSFILKLIYSRII